MTYSTDEIIVCNHITKVFGNEAAPVVALNDVSFSINEGEFFMIVGPSGCGKTTLISIIAGILKPDKGECIVLNNNLAKLEQAKLLNFRLHNVGFIFQAFNLIPTITVAENVAMPLIIQGVPFDEAIIRANELLRRVNLFDKNDSFPTILSGGQQQRVAIARSLIHNPKIIICDEPTSALDYHTGTSIMELMVEINQHSKTTFVIVSHDNRIFKYADRMAIMNDGQITKITGKEEPYEQTDH